MADAFKAVVLAAGKGTRMMSELPKVMHLVQGLPMLSAPCDIAVAEGADEVAVVVGYGRELVEPFLASRYGERVTTHIQHEMNGTADAVRSALPAFANYDGGVLILYGDVPNLPAADVRNVIALHREGGTPLTMLSAIDTTKNAYGRIVRDDDGRALRIVEHEDASEAERQIQEVNIGVYLVDGAFLREGLSRMTTDNAQGEFYLTDLIEMAAERGAPARVYIAPDIDALHGVNTSAELVRADEYAADRA
ncbi:MAG: bifunctional UDP-N-acetylglucosamine pyrophosphorylase/glucosamine-1-phosphate N-acetyltransferase [Bradymonadia bacterium]|jgi:bifunctional UDP-N-acetylglucosamine pyrophosphorylase/glucosamine-1-phosphate N-acetyltransferase